MPTAERACRVALSVRLPIALASSAALPRTRAVPSWLTVDLHIVAARSPGRRGRQPRQLDEIVAGPARRVGALFRASSSRSSTRRWRPTISSSTLSCVAAVGPVGVGEVDLELGAHAGERAAQLVGRVGDEPPLASAGLLDPLEHVVHRAGQAGDLVVAAGHRHPAMEVAPADAATSARIASTGRSVRPTSHQSNAASTTDGEREQRRTATSPGS